MRSALRLVVIYTFLVASTLMATAGIGWMARTAWFAARATHVEGEIVRFEKTAGKGGWHLQPVYAYRDATGHRWEATTTGPARPAIGQKVAVVYDPAAPMVSAMDSVWEVWAGPCIVTIVGLMFSRAAWNLRSDAKAKTA